MFAAAGHLAPLGIAVTDATVGEPFVSSSMTISTTAGSVWADTRTRGNIDKTIRALKLHALKQSANSTCRFLGAGSKAMSMVFTFKKSPSSLKALHISLPYPLAQPCEGLFVKTAKGKRVLSVQFGRGDMGQDVLTKNAVAVVNVVRESLETRLVQEITFHVDRLALPVWSRRLFDRGKKHVFSKFPQRSDPKIDCMAPPAGPPMKRARVT